MNKFVNTVFFSDPAETILFVDCSVDHVTILVLYQNCKMKQGFFLVLSGMTGFDQSRFKSERRDLIENKGIQVKIIVQRSVVETRIVTRVRQRVRMRRVPV